MENNLNLTRMRCPRCFGAFQGDEAIATVPFDGFEGAQDIGLRCPHCERWVHIAYTTTRLEERRIMLQQAAKEAQASGEPALLEKWRRRQRAFKRDFDIFNKKVERRAVRKGKKVRE